MFLLANAVNLQYFSICKYRDSKMTCLQAIVVITIFAVCWLYMGCTLISFLALGIAFLIINGYIIITCESDEKC